SLLGELQKQREAQQAYGLKQSILGDPGNSDLAKTALVSGNSGELVKQMLTGSTSKKDITQKTIDAQKALDILNPQQATDRKVAELGQIDAAKESFKDQKAQADSQELAALMQKPPGSLSVEQQARKQALMTGAKMDPKTMSGTLKTMLIGDNSPGVLYKNAVGSLSQIQDLKDSLSQIPTDEWARFEGKGIEEFQKVHPDANIAGIQALQYMISRPLVRTALKEKGKIPQQEYDKFNSSVFNLLSKSPAERARLFDLISQGAEEDAQYNASALKQFGQLTGDSDYIKNHPEQFPQTLESLKEKQTKSTATKNSPKLGDIENGYVFIGGNPANPESWKKQ
ncbi:MAG TPA: hypothetical protein VN457_05260, partial [Chlamydiales bacterium]|nr:hypothetical protein [Chlamydiales bacterium]